MKHVLLALEHLHLRMKSNGDEAVIHRDVTPDNVLISIEQHAKLTDFGVGREDAKPSMTDFSSKPHGKPVGKSGYMAPEVLAQEEHGFKADLFSFGCLMYYLFTLKEPAGVEVDCNLHPQTPLEDRIRAHLGDRIELEQQIQADIPHQDQDLLLSLIQEKPENRPTHEGIRNHRPFQDLPDFNMGWQGVTDVERWLKRTVKLTVG